MTTRKLRDDTGFWIRRAASGVGRGVKYLVKSEGLQKDVARFTKKRRDRFYKKRLLSKRKKIIQVEASLEKLLQEEKNIRDNYRREEELHHLQ